MKTWARAAMAARPDVAITRLASSGYLRGRTQMAVVKGGAAPKMLAEEEHFHQARSRRSN